MVKYHCCCYHLGYNLRLPEKRKSSREPDHSLQLLNCYLTRLKAWNSQYLKVKMSYLAVHLIPARCKSLPCATDSEFPSNSYPLRHSLLPLQDLTVFSFGYQSAYSSFRYGLQIPIKVVKIVKRLL